MSQKIEKKRSKNLQVIEENSFIIHCLVLQKKRCEMHYNMIS